MSSIISGEWLRDSWYLAHFVEGSPAFYAVQKIADASYSIRDTITVKDIYCLVLIQKNSKSDAFKQNEVGLS
jgi:hypothetical protein